MTKVNFMKRRFSDIRLGYTLVAPVLAYTNFVLIAYNFTGLKETMGIEMFSIVFTVGLLALLSFTGKIFRTKQQAVDVDLVYEQSRKHAKTQSIILETLYKLIPDGEENMTIKTKIKEELDYLRKIQDGTT